MTHVHPFKDEGSDRLRAQVFDKRSATEAPSTAGGGGGTAAGTSISDAGGYFTGTDVEAALQELGAGGGGGGSINEIITESASLVSSSANVPLDNTKPQITEGTQFAALTTSFAATNSSSVIRGTLTLPLISANGVGSIVVSIYRDSTADPIGTGVVTIPASGYVAGLVIPCSSPAVNTSSSSYTVRFGSTVSTLYINGSGAGSMAGGAALARLHLWEDTP